MVFATCLAVVGDRLDAEYLYWSFHQDEPLAGLDESDEVIEAAETLATRCAPPDYDPVFINPLGDCRNGSEVVELGEKYDVPWEDTVSCLKKPKDHYGHCGTCDKCEARRQEFEKAGVEDPLYPYKED
jgi:7-cyano-7-deazaguanine synthase in queuosine biosynthesis